MSEHVPKPTTHYCLVCGHYALTLFGECDRCGAKLHRKRKFRHGQPRQRLRKKVQGHTHDPKTYEPRQCVKSQRRNGQTHD